MKKWGNKTLSSGYLKFFAFSSVHIYNFNENVYIVTETKENNTQATQTTPPTPPPPYSFPEVENEAALNIKKTNETDHLSVTGGLDEVDPNSNNNNSNNFNDNDFDHENSSPPKKSALDYCMYILIT